MPEIMRPAELSFFSLADRLAQISRQGDPLERLDAVISWEIFGSSLFSVAGIVSRVGGSDDTGESV
jgi:hypothetical protein